MALGPASRRGRSPLPDAHQNGSETGEGSCRASLPMGNLLVIEDGVTNDVVTRALRPHAGQGRLVGQSASAGTVDCSSVALEAERVVAIGAHVAAIPESRLPLLACSAQDPDALRQAVTFGARHRRPPDRFGLAPRFDWSSVSTRSDRLGHTQDGRLCDPLYHGVVVAGVVSAMGTHGARRAEGHPPHTQCSRDRSDSGACDTCATLVRWGEHEIPLGPRTS